jgi:hypothetical protein
MAASHSRGAEEDFKRSTEQDQSARPFDQAGTQLTFSRASGDRTSAPRRFVPSMERAALLRSKKEDRSWWKFSLRYFWHLS